MKKNIITLGSLCLLLSLASCGTNSNASKPDSLSKAPISEKKSDTSLSDKKTDTARPSTPSSKPSTGTKEDDSLKKIVIDAKPKRSYKVGEAITYTGMIVSLEDVETGKKEETEDYVCDPEEGTILTEAGTFTLTVKGLTDNVIPATFKILVEEADEDDNITKLEIKSTPTITEYYEGQKFSSTGLSVNIVKYINGVKRDTESTTDYTLSIKDGDVLNTVSSALEVTVTSNDPDIVGTSFFITVYEREETDTTRKSLTEVLDTLKASKNYTFTTTNSLRGSTVTKKFTEKAMYFDSTQTGIGHYGYAEENDGKVFKYKLDGETVTPGLVERDENKDQVIGLYSGKAIRTFHDIDVSTMPSDIVTGNTYQMDNLSENQDNLYTLIFLLGYEDGSFTLSEITRVRLTVMKGDMLKVEIKFKPSYSSSMDTLVGTVSDMGTTKLDTINNYLSSGKGAKVNPVLPDNFKAKLEAISSTLNYTYSVKRVSLNASEELVTKLDFVDKFTPYAVYTQDNMDPDDSVGYAVYDNKVFEYTVEGDGIVAGDYCTDEGSYITGLKNGIHSFNNIDLYYLDFNKIDDNTIEIKDNETLSVLAFTTMRTNYTSCKYNLQKVTLSLDGDNVKVFFDYGEFGNATGIISDIGSTSLPDIKAFLDSGKGPNDSSSKDTLKEIVHLMKSENNYTEDMGYSTGNKHIGTMYYLPNAVFVDYDEVEDETHQDYGYIDYNGDIHNFSVKTENGKKKLVLGSVAKEGKTLAQTSMYPTHLSVFEDSALETMDYNTPNKAFLTTDNTMVGEVCDFMGFASYKDTYKPYSCGFHVEKNTADLSSSILDLIYVVTTTDSNNITSYSMFQSEYSNFKKADGLVSFIGEFLNENVNQ